MEALLLIHSLISSCIGKNALENFKFYYTDVYDVDETSNILIKFYIRLDVNQVVHQRIVFSFMDFVGALGGVPGFLLQVGGWVVGSYSAFTPPIQQSQFCTKCAKQSKPSAFLRNKAQTTNRELRR